MGKLFQPTRRDRVRFERVMAMYLDDCYVRQSGASVKELALFLQVTRPYLSRMTRAITGESAQAYMRRFQLERAKKQLAETTLTVEQIARLCAFGTARSFRRFFVRTCGMTPTEYRQEVTKCQ